ncbi:MAG: hypothetical protein WBC04_13680 [Candidatus Acidiferrales bacterium]
MKALTEGLYVKHFQYGCGVVTESDVERTTIDFDLHGPKKFVTSIMVVEPAEGTPPKRSRGKRRKKAVTAGVAPAATPVSATTVVHPKAGVAAGAGGK